MSNTAPQLFDNKFLSLADKVRYMEKLMQTKCTSYFISLGFNKTSSGPVDHNLHGTIKTKKGESHTLSKPADDFAGLVNAIIEILEAL